jgi:hypothetical protein
MENNKIRQNKPPKGKGRPKGAKNKTTALLKDAVLLAAGNAGAEDGLVGYLTSQARLNPGPFMALLGKVLPMQITGENGAPIQLENIKRVIVHSNSDR